MSIAYFYGGNVFSYQNSLQAPLENNGKQILEIFQPRSQGCEEERPWKRRWRYFKNKFQNSLILMHKRSRDLSGILIMNISKKITIRRS